MYATRPRSRLLTGLLTVALVAACESSPTGPDVEPYAWSATYDTATKFGGANGTWRNHSGLQVTDDRRVLLGGTEILNPQLGETTLSWSMADGNGTNAEVRFLIESSSDYFWDDVGVAGRLFQGWIQNPGEGRLDYRGLAH